MEGTGAEFQKGGLDERILATLFAMDVSKMKKGTFAPCEVTQHGLAEILAMDVASISRHLANLRRAGLVGFKTLNVQGRTKKVRCYYLSKKGKALFRSDEGGPGELHRNVTARGVREFKGLGEIQAFGYSCVMVAHRSARLGHLEKAEASIKKAREVFAVFYDQNLLAGAAWAEGLVCMKRQHYDDALQHFKKAEEVFDRFQMSRARAHLLGDMADCMEASGENGAKAVRSQARKLGAKDPIF